MKKTQSYQFMVALFAMAGLLFTGVAQAQTNIKIAVVNPAELVQKAPQAEAARHRLEKEFSARRQKLQDMKNEINKEEKKLNRDSSAMSSDELQQKQDQLQNKQRRFQQLQQNYNQDVHQHEQQEFDKLRKAIYNVIVKVAKQKGYDLVLSDGIVYATNRIDLTNEVLKRLRAEAKSKSGK